MPLHTSPKWAISLCAVCIWYRTSAQDIKLADGFTALTSPERPTVNPEERIHCWWTATEEGETWSRDVWNLCETQFNCYCACHFTPFSSRTTAGHHHYKKKSQLYRVIQWPWADFFLSQHRVGRRVKWSHLPDTLSASIQGCTQVSPPETDEDSQSNSKFQLFTRLSEKLDSDNSSHSKFPNNISFVAERYFVLFGNTSHNKRALKHQRETIAGGGKKGGKAFKATRRKTAIFQSAHEEGSLTWWQLVFQSACKDYFI